ncbi:MAG: DUF5916 domain-containing protein [Flavobacterium sp.]|uniref:DUF5916 domain-containing protein n=1 Tax=Flavobacterium sp. TaxID=239 RepID=UPI00260C191E|nr:DUF5916 domain-containing protein [Flavobacterium sp.]MDD5149612.1 DUF5916 domain-containing protein [Flavobacterium sp.]
MPKFFTFILFFSILFSFSAQGQKKILQAKSTIENITIDGKIDEEVWKTAPIASDFIMFEPDNGKPIGENKKTEVKVLYDNTAIYISAVLYDDEPKKILKEITQRDIVGTADVFGVFINGFNDGQQDFQFFVSASGVQMDRLATEDGGVSPDNYNQDFSWDAVWDSKIKITDFGWVVEMKIPYAALRFSKSEIQTWGLNFYRSIRRDRQSYTWSPIDNKTQATRTQNGVLEGIQNIKTPTRLFFIPYSSYYYEKNTDGSENKFKVGMDIKYGINDSFTLDAILVPDFGQTKFDNVILNLSPYEQQFTENRPFFTEGTDLFNKGNLFYSRRIGGAPRFKPEDYDKTTEQITDIPATVNLLNALKVSGRTEGGLGIGVFNAITETTYATVENRITGEKRKGIVEPLTNYNELVLDQRFNHNSSISLTNTNVSRNGNYRDANVTALLFNLSTKENAYKLSGDFKFSAINTNQLGDFKHIFINRTNDYTGYKTSLGFEKTKGKYRFFLFGKYISSDYDINDLGIGFQTNYHNAYADISYRILNPINFFNTLKFILKSSVEIQNTTGKVQDNFINAGLEGSSKSNDYYKVFLQVSPIESFDFYQPRILGRYSYIPKNLLTYFVFSSNYNNSFAIDFNPYVKFYDEKKRIDYGFDLSPRYRINDKILLIYSLGYYKSLNDRGYVDNDGTNIYYAQRELKTVSNELSGKLALNNKMTINLTARYYWSFSENNKFFTLQNDGYLTDTTYIPNTNENFNAWNFDLSYSWWFAPASQISVLYRNNASDYRNEIDRKIGNNMKNLFNNNLNNIFSVSIRYYIDYNSLKSKK